MFVLVRAPDGHEEIMSRSGAIDVGVHLGWVVVKQAEDRDELLAYVGKSAPGYEVDKKGKISDIGMVSNTEPPKAADAEPPKAADAEPPKAADAEPPKAADAEPPKNKTLSLMPKAGK